MPDNSQPLEYQIKSSVGRKSKGAVNDKADVETIQAMFRLAVQIDGDQRLDPGAVDGTIENESDDDTIRAIEAFQSRFFKPDGVISVGKRTWRELVDLLEGGDDVDEGEEVQPGTPVSTTPVTSAPGDGQFFFPFKESDLPSQDWISGIRCFGARRSSGARAHAGCDLYAPVGTTIHAIASGTVTLGPYLFYAGTYALEVDHGTFLARYGEIQQKALVKAGDRVEAGQPIAKVGKLIGMKNAMLHLELYDKSASGPLTVKNKSTKRTSKGVPFMRRADLIDPTQKLNQWNTKRPT
jgi:murein DD-endopeptidase MepM/ murein hydrolase activator NlpD